MARGRPIEVEEELLEAFRRSGRVSEYLVRVLPVRIWRADPPAGRGRDRRAHAECPAYVRPDGWCAAWAPIVESANHDTGAGAASAPAIDGRSRALVRRSAAVAAGAREGMPRRVVDMLTYLIQHDAHHRGQICMLARDLGHTFRGNDGTRMWGWRKDL
jgi:DinB family